MCLALAATNYFSRNEIGPIEKIDINNSHIIRSLIDKRDLKFYKWLVFDGIKYVLNDMMIISINEFGKIKHLILDENNELIFFLKYFLLKNMSMK